MTQIEELDADEFDDEDSVCQLCGVELDPDDAMSVNGHATCRKCVVELSVEIAESEAGAASLPMAALGTLVGAGLGAIAWAGVTISTEYQIGYVAVLVGYLAGKGAVLATGGRHGRPLQILAVIGSLLGMLGAKYAMFAHMMTEWVAEETGEQIGYFHSQVLADFFELLPEMFDFFDLLWLFFAVSTAWRIPASVRLHVDDA